MIDKMSNWDFGYPHAIYDMFAGVYQASSVFYADQSRWFAYVSFHLYAILTFQKTKYFAEYTELKVYCMCIWNLANLDTSTAKKILAHIKQQKAKTNLIVIGVTFTLKRKRIIE